MNGIGRPLVEDPVPCTNDGNDNAAGNLIVRLNEKIPGSSGKIYEIKRKLGNGQYGNVYKAMLLHAEPDIPVNYAIKVATSQPEAENQIKYETDVLQYLRHHLPEEAFEHICIIYDFFPYKNHLCLVTDLLSHSLMYIIKERKYNGVSIDLVQSVMKDVLIALKQVHSLNLIHCDVKLENILQVNMRSKHVKLIDFGCCCPANDSCETPVQTLYYRAPEVILRYPLTPSIDVWSLGCVAAELFLGLPLFCATSEEHLIWLISETLGPFPPDLVMGSNQQAKYFNENGTMKSKEEFQSMYGPQSVTPVSYFRHTRLQDHIMSYPISIGASEQYRTTEMRNRMVFLEMLNRMLAINPEERITAEQALDHEFMKIVFED